MADRNYARSLAMQSGHPEAMDFIDVADDSQLEDMITYFEAEIAAEGN